MWRMTQGSPCLSSWSTAPALRVGPPPPPHRKHLCSKLPFTPLSHNCFDWGEHMTKAEPSRCFLPGIWNLDSLLAGCFLGTETQELWGNHLLLRAREKERWEGILQKKSEADKQRKAEMSLAMFSAILVPPRAVWPPCVGVHESSVLWCTCSTQTRLLSSGTASQKNWCFQTVVLERRLLTVPWTAKRSNQSILEVNPEYSLEGLMLKLQYSGHLMWRADSLEKILMLGKIEGKKRRGQRRMMVG